MYIKICDKCYKNISTTFDYVRKVYEFHGHFYCKECHKAYIDIPHEDKVQGEDLIPRP